MLIDVDGVIERTRIGPLHWLIIALCGMVVLLDGYDIQAVAFVGPVLAKQFELDAAALGRVFAASPVGILLGAMFVAPLGDRFGRRAVLTGSFVLVAVASLVTALANSEFGLLGCRLATGLGLGGTLPIAISLTAEYLPRRHRALLVSLMFAGVPLGGFIGGLSAYELITASGWRAVFVVGGAVPLLLALPLYLMLPESLRFLSQEQKGRYAIAPLLARLDRAYHYQTSHQYVLAEPPSGSGVSALLANGKGRGTLLLWLVFFANFALLYLLLSWLPALLTHAGWEMKRAIEATTVFMLGGALGGLSLSWLVDRFNPHRVLAISYGVTTAAALAFAFLRWTTPTVFALTFVLGTGTVGAQSCNNVLAANFYPTRLRATGIGWGLGVGRIGAIVSPILAGMALAAGFSSTQLLSVGAAAATVCSVGILRFGNTGRQPAIAVLAPTRLRN